MEMSDEVFSLVGAKDVDTSGYQVTDLNEFEFYWENDQLDVDSVFGPRTDTPFSPTAFNDLKMRSSSENPILLDEKEDKNSPPKTSIFEKSTRPPALLRSRPFGTRKEIVPAYVHGSLFY